MPVVIREDLADEFNWSRIEETYNIIDDVETITRRLTIYDNGQTRDETFGEEMPPRGSFDTVVLVDSPDDDGTVPWERIERRDPSPFTDQPGSMSLERIYLDNGVVITFIRRPDGGLSAKSTHDHPIYSDYPSEVLPSFNNFPFANDAFETGNNDWYAIHVFYDQTEQVSEVTSIFDNGIVQSEQFEDGVVSSVSRSDWSSIWFDSELQDWQQITEQYDSSGEIAERITDYDDGIVETETFANGVRTELVKEDNPDPGGTSVESWDRITYEYDTSGQQTRRLTEYDDGAIALEEYTGGVRTLIQRTDGTDTPDGSNVWREIASRFDDTSGLIENRLTRFDNGVVHFEDFSNGVRRSLQQLDGPQPEFDQTTGQFVHPEDPGALAWQSIRTAYDAGGEVYFRRTVLDNGIISREGFDDGARDFTQQIDGLATEQSLLSGGGAEPVASGVRNWSYITTVFDRDTGLIENRTTVYDNGVQKLEEFDPDGALFTKDLFDGDPQEVAAGTAGPGARAWTSIEADYLDGELTSRRTTFDDDTYRLEQSDPADGVSLRVEQLVLDTRFDTGGVILPDQSNLKFVITDYGADGEVSTRSTLYSDGGTRTEFYEAPAQSGSSSRLSHVLEADSDDNIHPWEIVFTSYSEGQIDFRKIIFDNGIERTEDFSNGRLSSIEDVALDDVLLAPPQWLFTSDGVISPGTGPFPSIDLEPVDHGFVRRGTTLNESGAVASRSKELSNGDETASLYVDGQISEQHQLDGNGDQAWLGRILYYTQGAVTDRIEFYSEDEMPDNFAFVPSSGPSLDDFDPGTATPQSDFAAGAFVAALTDPGPVGAANSSATPESDIFDFA